MPPGRGCNLCNMTRAPVRMHRGSSDLHHTDLLRSGRPDSKRRRPAWEGDRSTDPQAATARYFNGLRPVHPGPRTVDSLAKKELVDPWWTLLHDTAAVAPRCSLLHLRRHTRSMFSAYVRYPFLRDDRSPRRAPLRDRARTRMDFLEKIRYSFGCPIPTRLSRSVSPARW
jgi:hypothetical protein